MTEPYLGPYRVKAFNASKESENKIHDDAVARQFGFRGGLVPGVDVYAYMTHLGTALGPRLARTRRCRMPFIKAGLRRRDSSSDSDGKRGGA
jgi:hypothetical protein